MANAFPHTTTTALMHIDKLNNKWSYSHKAMQTTDIPTTNMYKCDILTANLGNLYSFPINGLSHCRCWTSLHDEIIREKNLYAKNGSFKSCNAIIWLVPKRLHEYHESILPFISPIELVRSKLSLLSFMQTGLYLHPTDSPALTQQVGISIPIPQMHF